MPQRAKSRRRPSSKLGPNPARRRPDGTLIAIGGVWRPEILLGEEWNGGRAKSWQTKELVVVPINLSVRVPNAALVLDSTSLGGSRAAL